MKKHIEVHAPSLAECYARLRDMLTIQDLGHEAWVTVDVEQDSRFDASYIRVCELTRDCARCRHHNDHGCVLDDLEPCRFVPKI